MNYRAVFNICLKVVGVFYALKALNMLPSTITQIIFTWDAWKHAAENDVLQMMVNYRLASIVSLLIPFLLLLIALLIVFKSESIANLLLSKNNSSEDNLSANLSSFALDISIKIFGFFSILSSVPYLSKLLSRFWIMKGNLKLYDNTGKIELASSGITAALYIFIGVLLIIHSDALTQRLLGIEPKE